MDSIARWGFKEFTKKKGGTVRDGERDGGLGKEEVFRIHTSQRTAFPIPLSPSSISSSSSSMNSLLYPSSFSMERRFTYLPTYLRVFLVCFPVVPPPPPPPQKKKKTNERTNERTNSHVNDLRYDTHAIFTSAVCFCLLASRSYNHVSFLFILVLFPLHLVDICFQRKGREQGQDIQGARRGSVKSWKNHISQNFFFWFMSCCL
ncbi:hypothetical protein B0T26DRAFT_475813 [Lasiosphaeria miniovina]|uniref:Uncharacterized protein n=1 Tax=Lasiosphaeria miniovina TaxID=1954250 RepID=A0AA40DKR9_9PEZI|nr:uncharacterized protein B0T26DRAFT_475813 [Lasiosphaeria miniovina]KAK0706835.1 hypothetical protein B0T26DRAFT_475813 [Lasiosphaeria miniovina]